MNIVQPYAKIILINGLATNRDYISPDRSNAGILALRHIEWCGRISHRSEEAQSESSWERFIKAVVLDHGDWSIVEHATASVDFLVDRGITHELVRHRLFSFMQTSNRPLCIPLESTRFVNYEKKMPPAFIMPALASRIVVTGNLRSWRHLLLMRTTKETHPQFRQVSIPLLKEFQEKVPLLFADIEPEARQIDNMRKPH